VWTSYYVNAYLFVVTFLRMKSSNSHVIAFAVLQVIIVIIFLLFVRYDPKVAQKSRDSVQDGDQQIKNLYPMFQDVHVMIFIGFGFLMTFLKKYGLSAVSLNMICSALAIEVFTLVYGFFHLHCQDPKYEFGSDECESKWPTIDINVGTMISADFATASVLISFGVVLGVASPIQLVVMTVMETFIFVINEVIGRNYLEAVDAGDTIFVHVFGAYFGLTVARVLYQPSQTNSSKEGSSHTSDLFSMVGTVFLWIYWPSFNGGAAASGDAQQRALINTYYSLCSCVISTVVVSCLLNPERKMSMEHIQNATLAGGVAVGASADMMLTPGGAVMVGALAGVLSTLGFQYVQPFLLEKLKVHDSCGVNNLHGMPGLLGAIISVIMAGIASPDSYDQFSGDLPEGERSMSEVFLAAPNQQAVNQLLALLVTLATACVGGLLTGLLMHSVGKMTSLTEEDLFDDRTNINAMEAKCEVPEEILCLLQDFKAKSNGTDEKSALLQ